MLKENKITRPFPYWQAIDTKESNDDNLALTHQNQSNLSRRFNTYFVSFCICLLVIITTISSPSYATTNDIADPVLKELLRKAIAETGSFQDKFEAEVWFTDMNQRLKKRVKNSEERISLLNMIHTEARRVDLQPELVMAVIQIESNFDRWAISRVGARGLMQVMPFWLKEIGRPGDDLFNANTNLRMGCTILRHYLDKEKGNIIKALGRYNGSLGSYRYPRKVLGALRNNWYRP